MYSRLHHQETSATAKKRTHFEPVVAPKPLSDQAIRIFLARTHPTLFEKQAVERCPKKLYPRCAVITNIHVTQIRHHNNPPTAPSPSFPRLLATALMSPTPPTPPRDFVVRVLLRHWPVASVSVDDLSAAHPPFAAAAAAVSRRHRGGRPAGTPPPAADIEQEWAMDNVLVCLMENFLATLGYAHHRNRMKVWMIFVLEVPVHVDWFFFSGAGLALPPVERLSARPRPLHPEEEPVSYHGLGAHGQERSAKMDRGKTFHIYSTYCTCCIYPYFSFQPT